MQAFNWESCKQRWWNLLSSRVDELANWGFTSLWLPPAWDSLAPQGQFKSPHHDIHSLKFTSYTSYVCVVMSGPAKGEYVVKSFRLWNAHETGDCLCNKLIGREESLVGLLQ